MCAEEARVTKVRDLDQDPQLRFIYTVRCARCGDFKLPRNDARRIFLPIAQGEKTAGELRQGEWAESLHLLSGFCREAKVAGDEPPYIRDPDTAKAMCEAAPTEVADRSDRLLLNVARMSAHPGTKVDVLRDRDYPLAYSRNHQDFNFIARSLDGRRLIEYKQLGGGPNRITVTARGWERISELRKTSPTSRRAFIAMDFDDEFDQVYEGAIKPAVEGAGYKPVNMKWLEHSDLIDSRIVTEINRSRFLIADTTADTSGVYFEAGYALATGIPVIWTCRSDAFENVHFDAEHYNHIVWDHAEELREDLQYRIQALVP